MRGGAHHVRRPSDAPPSAVELHLPADVQYVWLARHLVVTAARQAGMADDRVEDLRIAVSEAVTNAITAQRRDGRGQRVVLGFGPEEGTFQVTVTDTGPGFEPVAPETMIGRDWTVEGGLGVTIIRGLADDVSFERADDGMAVFLRFGVGLPAQPS